jgi:hypothetical protein
MFRSFSSILILAAIALPAAAEGVTVKVAGRAPEAVRADIARAAQSVCSKAYMSMRVSLEERVACERAAVGDAEAKIRAASLALAAPVSLASADTTSGRR